MKESLEKQVLLLTPEARAIENKTYANYNINHPPVIAVTFFTEINSR
jgi:hypothetical protein